MAEVLVGLEHRILISGYGIPAPLPPYSLLSRLDQMGLRADIRRAPAQHQHIHLKGTLMDCLNLLESRIRQLGCELDGGGSKAVASSSVALPRQAEDHALSKLALMEPCKEPPAMCVADKPDAMAGSWGAMQILQRGARELHRNKPNQS